jgi:hypothetical protein
MVDDLGQPARRGILIKQACAANHGDSQRQPPHFWGSIPKSANMDTFGA